MHQLMPNRYFTGLNDLSIISLKAILNRIMTFRKMANETYMIVRYCYEK